MDEIIERVEEVTKDVKAFLPRLKRRPSSSFLDEAYSNYFLARAALSWGLKALKDARTLYGMALSDQELHVLLKGMAALETRTLYGMALSDQELHVLSKGMAALERRGSRFNPPPAPGSDLDKLERGSQGRKPKPHPR